MSCTTFAAYVIVGEVCDARGPKVEVRSDDRVGQITDEPIKSIFEPGRQLGASVPAQHFTTFGNALTILHFNWPRHQQRLKPAPKTLKRTTAPITAAPPT